MTNRMVLYIRILLISLLTIGLGIWLLFNQSGISSTSTENSVINGAITHIHNSDTFDWSVILGFFILLALMIIPFLVWNDARKRGYSQTRSFIWAAISFFLLPFGLILYLLTKRG